MTRDRMIAVLQDEYAARRDKNLAAYDERVAGICEQVQGLEALLNTRRTMIMSGIRNAFYPNRKNEGANQGMTNALQDLNKKINALLKENGFKPSVLDPIYTCPVCRDEGFVYDPSRRMCDCFETELNCRMLRELGLNAEQTFENFDPETFAKAEPAPVSQRQMMLRNRDVCEGYADVFPDTPFYDLLFTGQSGLGKTYLMHAIAHRVTARGFTVEYLSAFKLLDIMRRSYFENNNAMLDALIQVPMLLIDDLGTEPLMENITVTQLFNLLNERQNRGRHTVISTNLTIPELKARYTERIASRLLDESRCKTLKFIGSDVRPTLKNKAK
ncbi:MAG TPA: ATP-binding protein [Candidatus Limiplasma sp.]|nr:ATP-binding protein [Candidatus Limiplasma sp.]